MDAKLKQRVRGSSERTQKLIFDILEHFRQTAEDGEKRLASTKLFRQRDPSIRHNVEYWRNVQSAISWVSGSIQQIVTPAAGLKGVGARGRTRS